ncbi:DUF411 domain-containing protein [Thalassotalea aquiviva]|uniref:DUF411 domain-containing protein n=1 Tax=Thalassotalea aquiviva TaxID=3242415 RepID=UPI00352ABB21
MAQSVSNKVETKHQASEQQKSHQHPAAIELMVYKTPTCGCCSKWIDHLEQQDLKTQSKDLQDLSMIKAKFGIKPNMRSCHTGVSKDGYIFEGHVPAKFIKQFLAHPPANAIGLSVPAMPIGSPGMEMNNQFMPYHIMVLFKDGSHQVYASVRSLEEQF